jgi:hypothetical protein
MSNLILPRRNFILGIAGILVSSQAPAILTQGTAMRIWVSKLKVSISSPWDNWMIFRDVGVTRAYMNNDLKSMFRIESDLPVEAFLVQYEPMAKVFNEHV